MVGWGKVLSTNQLLTWQARARENALHVKTRFQFNSPKMNAKKTKSACAQRYLKLLKDLAAVDVNHATKAH